VSGEEVQGLAYGTDSQTLFGVIPSADDDLLVRIDPHSGTIDATLGSLSNGHYELVALAYDPGATPAADDDMLLALETDGVFEHLVTIDPTLPNQIDLVGPLEFGAPGGFRGLAYDSVNDKLYASSPFEGGIYEIDRSTCPFLCGLSPRFGSGLARFDSGLAYSRHTEMLYMLGSQSASPPLGPRTLYDIIDPNGSVIANKTIQVDSLTTGGLAALPITFPTPVPTLDPSSSFILWAMAIGGAGWRLRRKVRQAPLADSPNNTP